MSAEDRVRVLDRVRLQDGDTFIVTEVAQGYDGLVPVRFGHRCFGYEILNTRRDRLRRAIAKATGILAIVEAIAGWSMSVASHASAVTAANRPCRDCAYAGRPCPHRGG